MNDDRSVSENDMIYSSDVSGGDDLESSPEESFEDPVAENESTTYTQIYTSDFIDYSQYFENLQTIGIFLCGLLVAYGLAFAFFKGFRK